LKPNHKHNLLTHKFLKERGLKKLVCILSVLFLLLVVSACDERVVLENLSSKQSVEVAVKLRDLGIPAERLQGDGRGDKSWEVSVPENFYSESLKAVHAFSLPSADEDRLEELTRSKGFVPTSREMASLRLEHARSLQVERLLRGLPGLVDVKVLIRSLSDSSRRGYGGPEPSVSVVARINGISDQPPPTHEEIIAILQNSVPGISQDNISLSLSRVSLEPGPSLGNNEISTFWSKLRSGETTSSGAGRKDPMTVVGLILFILGLLAVLFFYFSPGRKSSANSSKKAELGGGRQKRRLLSNNRSN